MARLQSGRGASVSDARRSSKCGKVNPEDGAGSDGVVFPAVPEGWMGRTRRLGASMEEGHLHLHTWS